MKSKGAKARATLANILYDWKHERVPRGTIREILASLQNRWLVSAAAESPETVFRAVIDSEPRQFDGLGSRLNVSGVPCSRVMIAAELLENNLDPSALSIPVKGFLGEEQVKRLERLGVNGGAKGKMRTRRPYAWITPRQEIESIRLSCEANAANCLRDALGLSHIQEDDYLIEIEYPVHALDHASVSAPSFLEGCPSLIYRSKRGDADWGITVNLNGLGDGVLEAVHSEIPFTADFKLRGVGRLAPPSPSIDWEAFLAAMPENWEEAVDFESEDEDAFKS